MSKLEKSLTLMFRVKMYLFCLYVVTFIVVWMLHGVTGAIFSAFGGHSWFAHSETAIFVVYLLLVLVVVARLMYPVGRWFHLIPEEDSIPASHRGQASGVVEQGRPDGQA